MLFALQAKVVSPTEAMVRLRPPSQTSRTARRDGGIVLRALVLLAGVAVALIWWQGGRKTPSVQGVSAPPLPQKEGTLVIPSTDSSGRRAEPMVLVPVSARPTASPAPIPPPEPARPVSLPAVTNRAISPATTNVTRPPFDERVLAAQAAMNRRAISSGSLDGVMGAQTRAALRAFQQREGVPATGSLDEVTLARLLSDAPLYTNYVVTEEDLAGLLPLGKTWLEKSHQPALAYESILELVAEKSHSNPKLVRWLNPQIDWGRVNAGTSLLVANSEYPEPEEKAAFIRIFLNERRLQAFGANSNLLAHFPCSIAARVDKRPLGEELHIAALAPNPNYTFDPAVFPESAEAQELGRKLILQPGPNNPVGTMWFSLDKPGYGIHGTPKPEDVGRTESHGCFRLANWNAEYLLKLVALGTPVFVDP
jgi:lipoprotein-anchoring transpeptidase ErfK/SrfK